MVETEKNDFKQKIPINNSFYLDKKSGDIYSSDKKEAYGLPHLKGSQSKIKTSELSQYNFYASNVNNDELMDLFISDNYGTKCYNLETEIFDFDIISENQPKSLILKNNLSLDYQVMESAIYTHLMEKPILEVLYLVVVISNVSI